MADVERLTKKLIESLPKKPDAVTQNVILRMRDIVLFLEQEAREIEKRLFA
jgi:hypothetical protein